jgi:hypothetical protein
MVNGIDDGMNHRLAELRVVRATVKNPQSADQWRDHFVVTSAPGNCGGLCGAGSACIAGAMGQTCAPTDSTCSSTCDNDEACVAGACTTIFVEPKVASIGSGTGLFAQLVFLPDDRMAIVYYNYSKRALEIAVEQVAGGNTFDVTPLDGNTNGDRGMWARAAVDTAGTIHIAYQDALGDQLMYMTWTGGTASPPEVVDDGQRPPDRPNPVGAGATMFLSGATPTIAYQNGATADVHMASKNGSWAMSNVAQGPLLDGFWVSGTLFKNQTYLAWGSLDPAATPLGTIKVHKQ